MNYLPCTIQYEFWAHILLFSIFYDPIVNIWQQDFLNAK